MPVTDLPAEQFLRKEYIDRMIAEKVNGELIWDPLFPVVTTDSKSVSWLRDQYSHMSDPKKLRPPLKTQMSEFAQVEITGLDRESTALKGWGAQLIFSPDVLVYKDQVDEVVRARDRFAYWLAEFLNNWVIDELTNDWSTTFTNDTRLQTILTRETNAGYEDTKKHIVINHNNTTYGWDDASANPIGDIIQWRTAFGAQEPSNQERYGYTLTDVFVDEIEFGRLLEYLVEIDAKFQLDPLGGALTIAQIAGVTLHETRAAFYDQANSKKSGYAILLDRDARPATIYQTFDPRYDIVGDRWNTYQYDDDKTHARYYQAWTQRVAVLKEPKAFGLVYNLT